MEKTVPVTMKTRHLPRLSRKAAQRFAFGIACLATAVAAIYLIEDYRGQAAWDRYVASAQARGADLYFAAFIPQRIPDQENFAALEFFDELSSSDQEAKKRLATHYILPYSSAAGFGAK
jgi:hypothetical protein